MVDTSIPLDFLDLGKQEEMLYLQRKSKQYVKDRRKSTFAIIVVFLSQLLILYSSYFSDQNDNKIGTLAVLHISVTVGMLIFIFYDVYRSWISLPKEVENTYYGVTNKFVYISIKRGSIKKIDTEDINDFRGKKIFLDNKISHGNFKIYTASGEKIKIDYAPWPNEFEKAIDEARIEAQTAESGAK